jgi:hypothetical protein
VTGLEQTTNALKQEIDRLHREKDETNDLHKQSIALINAKIVELEDQLKEVRESASPQRSLGTCSRVCVCGGACAVVRVRACACAVC